MNFMRSIGQIQSAADAYLDGRQADAQAKAEREAALAEAIEDEAYRIAERIAKDPDELYSRVESGDLIPHEIRMIDRSARSVERALHDAVSFSLIDPRNNLRPVAESYIRALMDLPEIREQAERRVS